MAARVSSRRRWSLRDVPRTYVLFVWLPFGLAVFIYANTGTQAAGRRSGNRKQQ